MGQFMPETESQEVDVAASAIELATKIVDKGSDKEAAGQVLSQKDQEEADFQARQDRTPEEKFVASRDFLKQPEQLQVEADQFGRQTGWEQPAGPVFDEADPWQTDADAAAALPDRVKPYWNPDTGAFETVKEGFATVPYAPEGFRQEQAIMEPTVEEKSTLELMQNNIRAQAEIQMAEADMEALEVQKTIERNEAIDRDSSDKLASDEAQIEKAITAYETANADLTNLKVDPDRWYASRSTGQKIAGALAVALGGYQRGLAGRGDNPMLKAMNKAIDQDVRTQLLEHKDKKAGVASKKNLVGFYRDRLQNDQQAVAAAKMKINGDAQMRVLAFKAKNKGTQAGLNADKLLIDLQVSEARYKAEFARSSMKENYAAQKEERANRALNIGVIQNGRMLQANTPEAAAKTREDVAKLNSAKRTITAINSYLNEYDVIDYANPSSEVKAKMGAATTALKASFRIMLVGPGTISDADRVLINEALPKLGGGWGSVTGKDLARYNALLQQFEKDTEDRIIVETRNADPSKVYQRSASYQDRQAGPAPKRGK